MKTSSIIPILQCLIDRGTRSEHETRFFSNVSHDTLVNTLTNYLNAHRHFLGYCHIEQRQALNEKGVDLMIETNNCKVGFQVKSHFDITERDFSAKVKRQFAESFSHGLNHYFILVCSAFLKEGKNDYKARVAHLLNELSLFRNVNFDAYGPLTTIGIFKDPPQISREELLRRKVISDDCLNEYEKGYVHLPKVDDDEILRLQEVVNSYGDLFESEEGGQAFHSLQQLIEKRQAEQFKSTFLPTLPPDIVQRRTELIEASRSLLVECRKCRSWDDNSEYKLSSWVEHIPETMIPYTSLPNLLRITESLKEYLEIHRRMDKELKDTP